MSIQNKPLISIVIVNYNGKKYLHNCLKSVFNSNYKNFEVILVDNASENEILLYLSVMEF